MSIRDVKMNYFQWTIYIVHKRLTDRIKKTSEDLKVKYKNAASSEKKLKLIAYHHKTM